MTHRLLERESFWEMLKWKLHFQAIPQEMAIHLAFDKFDFLKNLYISGTKLDIALENLSVHFILNEQLKEENVSLYGTSKDICY